MSHILTIYTDGASLDNPGESGVGLVIINESDEEETLCQSIGIATQDQAQYEAVIRALNYGIDRHIPAISVYVGNRCICEELKGQAEAADPKTRSLRRLVLQQEKLISATFSWADPAQHADKASRCLELALKACTAAPTNPEGGSHNAIQQSAGGVVYKKEKGQIKVCLIAKKQGKMWSLPKGRVQSGESWEQAAIREVMEETGHLATISDHLNQIDYIFYWKENRTLYHKIVSFYLMPLITENASIRDGEADIVSWFTLGEAWRRLFYQSEKGILKQAQDILKAAKI